MGTFLTLIAVMTGVIQHALPGAAMSTSIAVDPDRVQLIKDALDWMTFRENGVLLSETEVQFLFLQPILDKYATSKLYRTFVIAFQHGVLPKLTLNENDACDPAYTEEYRDPYNSSVTWYSQKQFTFKSYDEREQTNRQYCDYRQGLVCMPKTGTCQCPKGSKIQPISPNSPVKRCLLDEGEICSLIDIAHGNDPSHELLASHMYHLIFNMEKPLSCKEGTQCRFKDSNKNLPFCYEVNSGPWYPMPPAQGSQLDFGVECAIGLYATPGSCRIKSGSEVGYIAGFVCYNFGPPRSLRDSVPVAENRIGFCAHEYGRFSITNEAGYAHSDRLMKYHTLFTAYVYPRTVPLRGSELASFYEKYLSNLFTPFFTGGTVNFIEASEGGKCSVSRTQTLEDAWKYFQSLEDDLPPGQDYVPEANKAELHAKLDSLIAFKSDHSIKMCQIYSTNAANDNSLQCVPDGVGDDGKCQKPGKLDTQTLNVELKKFQKFDAGIQMDLYYESFRLDILLAYPEPPCLPTLGPLPPQQLRHHNPDALEDGYCPDGSVCYQDFSDSHGLYWDSCDFKYDIKQSLLCHDTSRKLEKCEDKHLTEKLNEALGQYEEYAKLQEGEPCHYSFEKAVREGDSYSLRNINKYQLLNWLERNILCDKKERNLECTEGGTCECIGDECVEPEPETEKPKRKPEGYGGHRGGVGGNGMTDGFKLIILITNLMVIFN